MRKDFIRFGVILFCAMGMVGIQQAWPSEMEDYLAQAKAGYANYRQKANGLVILQQMDMDTAEGQITQQAKVMQLGRKFRIDLTPEPSAASTMTAEQAENNFTVIFDGAATWLFSEASGRKKLSGQESLIYQRDSNLWDYLMQTGQVVREEMVGNYNCFVAQAEDEEAVPYTLWIEKGTWNLIQAERNSVEPGKVNWWNSDFRKVNGEWEIPYKMEIYVDNKLVSTNTVKSVQVNQDMEDEWFDPDHEAPVR